MSSRCPDEHGAIIEITSFEKVGGELTKRISLSADGTLLSDGSACIMSRGCAFRRTFATLEEFATFISGLESNQAIALGRLRADLPDQVRVATKDKLREFNGSAAPDLISRTGDFITYQPEQPAFALVDIDSKGMPLSVKDAIVTAGGYWKALVSILPELASTAHIIRRSTSAGIFDADTGAAIPGSNGLHIFVMVADGDDVDRFLQVLHARCWLRGFGWMMVGRAGQLLERSLVDRTVSAPERLVFEAGPVLDPPLMQDTERRMPIVRAGAVMGTRTACMDLTIVELAKLRDQRKSERRRLAPVAAEARSRYLEQRAEELVIQTGKPLAAARQVVESQCEGILLPDVSLLFDESEFAGVTVRDILADPDRFVGATLADPLEGTDYGRCKAKIMRRSDGSLWINSFAHGRTIYELKHDAPSVEAGIRAVPKAEVAQRFVQMLLMAEVSTDDEVRLRDLACELSGSKARPLTTMLKEARERSKRDRTRSDRERREARSHDSRIRLPAPAADDERLPVLATIDEVLTNVVSPEPPMRDLNGWPVEVRSRPPFALHELTSDGSNTTESKNSRLPPPDIPLLTLHNRHTLAQEIERHLALVVETEDGERPVALQSVFLDHYIDYRDSKLPRVGAVLTAPLVLPDGLLLAPRGLDCDRKLVFRIEPRLLDLLPTAADCDPTAVAAALDFLVNEWLCDVALDFTGKCVLVALALTILERVLLPERPAFFITAGKRGGGKTTAVSMVMVAVTGKRPAAAAWSTNLEERRKAMLSYLAEGPPAVVWDNIPLGTTITCPILEQVLTLDTWSDRLLGQSTSLTVQTHTIMVFTGNNIGPRGDLSSRSLGSHIEIDQPDPENRTFRHMDPIEWTVDNRGEILRCLYTILLGNPQLRPQTRQTEKTRFKRWWHLVGSAVENAAVAMVSQHGGLRPDRQVACTIDFNALFARAESEDDDTIGLVEALDALHATYGETEFQAATVAEHINAEMEKKPEPLVTLELYFRKLARKPGPLNAIGIGVRLKSMVGAPVRAGERILKLVKGEEDHQARNHRTGWYKVKEAPIASRAV